MNKLARPLFAGAVAVTTLLGCTLPPDTPAIAAPRTSSPVVLTSPLEHGGAVPSAQEERVVPVIAIITAVILVGGSVYKMGQVAGERSFYAGLRNSEYQRIKSAVRAAARAALGPAGGLTFMTGFENESYSLVN